MPVLIRSEYNGPETPDIEKLLKTAEQLLGFCGLADHELSILLVGDEQMKDLNREYRQKDKPTNVLSFPLGDDGPGPAAKMLGDIVISVDTAAREGADRDISTRERIVRLLVHGLVHLLGLDHERSVDEAARMLEKENKLLERLQNQ